MKKVMVIAGTKDARDIINELVKMEVFVVATVATGFGKEMLEDCGAIRVYEGKLEAAAMECLINKESISCVVDASHPFAREVSINAMRSCANTGAAYLRFERCSIDTGAEGVIRVKTFKEAANAAGQYKGNILLTIGSNNIDIFAKCIADYKKRLYARVLPDSRVIAKCEEAGLTAGNIIAIKGPFSVEMNMEILKYCRAEVLVSKESGETGGTAEKLDAARKLGIPVVLVERPDIAYPQKVSTIDKVIEFVKNI